MADGYEELEQAARNRRVTEERYSRMSCWRQGDFPRFLSLLDSSTATVAPLVPPSILDGKRSGKRLSENRPAEDRKQSKHGSKK